MKFDALQSSFNSGELSPRLRGQVELEKYKSGVSFSENLIVQPHGGLIKRGGFHFVAEVKNSERKPIIVEFNYKNKYAYVLEIGEYYIRFYLNQEQVQEDSAPYEVVTTYAYNELQDLGFSTDEDTLYLTHTNHPPAALTRTEHTDWDLSDIVFVHDYEHTWILRNSAADNDWQSVCWSPELEIYCAVADTGTSNRVMTSEDGINWDVQVSAADEDWQDICWSSEKELFVAVANTGTGNRVMTSSDGVTWGIQVSAEDNDWMAVCWSPELGLFVAVASSGTEDRVMVSEDGITWETKISAADNDWQSVCWSPLQELFVAVANASNPYGYEYKHTWEVQTPAAHNFWQSVCWSPELELFVAVSSDGAYQVMTSSDGKNWDTQTAAEANEWRSVCWSPLRELFVAVSRNGTHRVMTSPDGAAWTYRVTSGDNDWHSVCWSPEKELFVAVAQSGDNRAMSSSEGINWDNRDTSGDNDWQSVCWSPELELFVAVADTGGSRVMTSSDGFNWTNRGYGANYDWVSVCWSPELELFVAVAEDGGYRTMCSSDGFDWVTYEAASEEEWQSVCWSVEKELFIAVAQTGTNNRVMTSPDGKEWTSRVSAADNDWQGVCWSPELKRFVAVASTGVNNRVMTSENDVSEGEQYRVMTSPDGDDWTTRAVDIDNGWKDICWSPTRKLFVAIAESGTDERAMTSSDGVEWEIHTVPDSHQWQSICWSYEFSSFIAVAKDGTGDRIMTSPDGKEWTLIDSPADNDWTAICNAPGIRRIAAVAESGTGNRVMTSSEVSTSDWHVTDEIEKEYTYETPEPWEIQTCDTESWMSICWSPGLGIFVAGAHHNTMTSSDGKNWTTHYTSVDGSWSDICWSPELEIFVATSYDGVSIATSEDGINWDVPSGIAQENWRAVCWAPEISLFCAVGAATSGLRILTSPDGVTWTPQNVGYSPMELYGVCWSPSLGLFATATGRSRCYVSPDGVNWNFASFGVSCVMRDICWSPEKELFCAVGHGLPYQEGLILTSFNGYDWETRVEDSNVKFGSICWSGTLSLFVALNREYDTDENRVYTSSDGITWESVRGAGDNNNSWYELCWSHDLRLFVAVSRFGTEEDTTQRVMTSPTGKEVEVETTVEIPINNYPAINWFYEQRHFFASTPHELNAIWGSKSAKYNDLRLGTGLDNEGLKLKIKAASKFLWASSGEEILLGGANAEFKLSANALNEALTPSNVRPVLLTNYGSADREPVRIDDSVIMLQKGERIFRRLAAGTATGGYSNKYRASDLTILSNHIAQSGIQNYMYINLPASMMWAARTDGRLIGLTYEPEHKIFGWHRHTISGTDAKVHWLAPARAVEGVRKDEVWAVIERTINGATVSYLEYMTEGLSDEDDIEDSFFVDSGVTETGDAFTVVNGLSHLEGETVAVLGDGVVQDSKVVSSGSITLDTAVDKVHVGLPYESSIVTLPIEGGNPLGTSQGLIKRIRRVALRLDRSSNFKLGDVNDLLDEYSFSSSDLFTGDTEPTPFTGSFDRQSKMKIVHDSPLPFNLLAIMYEAKTS